VETINTIENIVAQDGKVFEDINIYLNALGALIRL
jgi:type IV pilus assembly protein PilM